MRGGGDHPRGGEGGPATAGWLVPPTAGWFEPPVAGCWEAPVVGWVAAGVRTTDGPPRDGEGGWLSCLDAS
jgi:hypothetical protein